MPFRFQFGLRWAYFPVGGGPPKRDEGKPFFDRVFMKFQEGVGDFAPAFRLIAEDILEPVVEQNFRQERGEVNWADLAPSTVARRGSEHPILHVTGMLQESFQKGQPAHHEEISPRKLVWGSDVPYALFHQTGTGKGYGKDRAFIGPLGKGEGRGMPRRKEISVSDKEKQMMANTMVGRMAQVARMIGFRVVGRGATPLEARMAGEQILAEKGLGAGG